MNMPSLTGLAGLGVAAACWQQIRSLAARLSAVLVVQVTAEQTLAKAVRYYCWTRCRRSPVGSRRYTSQNAFVRPLARYQQIATERTPGQPIVFWKGWRPLLLGTYGYDNGSADDERVTFRFLRGTFDPDALVEEALAGYNELFHSETANVDRKVRRYHVHRVTGRDKSVMYAGLQSGPPTSGGEPCAPPKALADSEIIGGVSLDRVLGWQPGDLGPLDPANPLEAFAFPDESRELVEEARRWRKSEAWFKDKRVPWRRGWLLYGRPGTGKTSLVRAVAQLIDAPVFVYDLATLSNEEFTREWKSMLAQAPCVALMEDLDAVFHGRENVSGVEGGLTFDCLLNCIGGVEEAEGVFTVMTTNDLSKIDPALGVPGETGGISSRPGRLDRAVELKSLNKACRRRLASRILADCAEKIERTVHEGDGDTAAQFQERCSQIALAHYWRVQA